MQYPTYILNGVEFRNPTIRYIPIRVGDVLTIPSIQNATFRGATDRIVDLLAATVIDRTTTGDTPIDTPTTPRRRPVNWNRINWQGCYLIDRDSLGAFTARITNLGRPNTGYIIEQMLSFGDETIQIMVCERGEPNQTLRNVVRSHARNL